MSKQNDSHDNKLTDHLCLLDLLALGESLDEVLAPLPRQRLPLLPHRPQGSPLTLLKALQILLLNHK